MLASLPRVVSDFFKVLVADKMPSESGSCLHQAQSLFPRKNRLSVAHSTVDFNLVKAIQKQGCPAGTTINDVVLTAFCGAIYRYMEHNKDPSLSLPGGPLMRSMCAFSMPDLKNRAEGSDSLYNEFVMPSIKMCIQKDRMVRLKAMTDTMNEVKTSFQGPLTMILSSALGQLGLEEFAGKTNAQIFQNHSFVYSNVPGFTQQVYAFGEKMNGLQAYYGNVINQTIFMSCMGQLSFSLMTDKATVKDPQFLVDAFVSEVKEWHSEVAGGQ